MANRFPLVLDTTDNNKIKEIQAGDNLTLADNSIVDVQNITALGTIDAADIRVGGARLVAQAFNDLTDTPATFIGAPNYFVKVKADGTGLEYRPLSDLGNIEIDTITVDTSIVPTTDGTGNLGNNSSKFNEVVSNTLRGNLESFDESIVFNATTGKISYAALEGAPTFLSEFTDDIGYLREADLDAQLSGLFDDGSVFVTDIQGSVFSDDSSLVIDGLTGIVHGIIDTSSGTIDSLTSTQINSTGVVTASVTGNNSNLTISAGSSTRDVVIGDADADSTRKVKIYNAVMEEFEQGAGLGIAKLTTSTDLEITAGNRVKLLGGVPFRLASTTSSDQLAIAAQEGDLIYNTTTNRLQMYQGSAWKDVNGNVEATTGTSNFNNVVIAGNLTVTGTTTNVETTNTNITDNIITLNQGETGAGVTLGSSGIEVERGTEANKTFVWDETTDKWTLGSETLVAATFEGNLTGSITGNTQGIHTGDVVGNLTGNAAGNHTGTFDGEVTGSVFADDSGILVDGVNGKVVGDVDNAEVVTTTVQGREGTALNIYRGATGTVSLGDASSGSVSVSNTGINITATAGVDINGAASGTVEIGTGGSSGNVTIGKAGNTTTVDGTFNATLSGNVIGDVTGNVTGNIDNTTLALGPTDATTIAIGNSGSTTTINGTVSMPAVVSGNITADDSMSITTATGDGNAISIGPLGTNRAVNLTADVIRISGDVVVPIVATAGVVGDVKGSVVGDDSTVLVDGVNSIVPSSVVSGTEATNWNTAYSWGDHSTENYVVSGTADIITATMVAEDVITTRELADGNNYNGTFDGDVTGSVFSDDSSIMVDAVDFAMFSDTLTLTPLNTEPANPVNGMIAVADGTGWDPASNAKNTLVAYLGGAWVTVAAAA